MNANCVRGKIVDLSFPDRHFCQSPDYHNVTEESRFHTAKLTAGGSGPQERFEMPIPSKMVGLVVVALTAGTAGAETMRSQVSFNTAVQQKAPEQPPDGIAVTYPVAFAGGELDGCTAQIAESLFPRDHGSWGIFQVEGDVACAAGAFGFTSSGSWDGTGFHGAGLVKEGSGSGEFSGLAGRVAQIGGKLVPANTGGTFDIGYELLVDHVGN